MRATRAWLAITLLAAVLLPAVPAAAEGWGTVSGVVTDESGVPLDEICVYAYGPDAADSLTDESGKFELLVPSGSYKISFHDCVWPARFAGEWYDDKPDFRSADIVEVYEGGEVDGVNAALSALGTISGTVTDELGSPIEGGCVTAVDARGEWAGAAETLSDGTYTVDGIASGSYGIHFHNCNRSGRFLGEWYDDKPDFESADLVEVLEGEEAAGVNAILSAGGSISGTVTDTRGDPIQGVCVEVRDEDGGWTEWMSATAEDGSYSAGGLPSGEFKVYFSDCQVSIPPARGESDSTFSVVDPEPWGGRHIPEWYDDARDADQADLVAVTQGEDTPGIDAALTIAGTIRGTVTDPEGWPAESVCVEAFDARTGAWGGSGYTWNEGAYTIDGLAPGTYKVKFSDCWKRRYRTEWFDDQKTEATAREVGVREDAVVEGIDAVMELLPVPDPAVTGLTVRSVPVQTDLGPLTSLGTQRSVGVAVSNLGTKASRAQVTVWATTPSDGTVQAIGSFKVALAPGESLRKLLKWDATGTVGDATVHARLCSAADVNKSNNHRSVETYSVVGGTGIGFRTAAPGYVTGCGDGMPKPYPTPTPEPTEVPGPR